MKLLRTIEGEKITPARFTTMLREYIALRTYLCPYSPDETQIDIKGMSVDGNFKTIWKVTVKENLTIVAENADGRKIRGKASKLLNALGMEEKYIKELIETVKKHESSYEIWITKDFVYHYQTMKDLGICKSCMAYKASFYEHTYSTLMERHIHPLEPYEQSEDFYLALAKPVGSTKEYPYTARTVVLRVGDKYFRATTYGEEVGKAILGQAWPHTHCNVWEGASIPKIESDRGVIAPYNDVNEGWEDGGDYLISSDSGDQCDYATGVLKDSCYCQHCENTVYYDEDEMYYVDGVGSVCPDCMDDYVWVESRGTYVSLEDAICCTICEEYAHIHDSKECSKCSDYICEHCETTYGTEDIHGEHHSFCCDSCMHEYVEENMEDFYEGEDE
jgi:hypothetical protein